MESSTAKPVNERSAREIAELLGIEYRETLGQISPPKTLVRGEFSRLIGSWGKQYRAIPVEETDSEIIVAVADPLNLEALDAMKFCYTKPLRVIVVPEEEILRSINTVRSDLMSERDADLDSAQDEYTEDTIGSPLKIDVTDAEDDDAPIIRYVNTLIFRAASQRASDIHIEPYEDALRVRFRVDGVLHDVDTEDKRFQAAIISRVKVMANLNIAEKRLPQDGRIGIRIAGQEVDIRVSTVPTRYGERIVMRLLDKSKMEFDLDSVGLSERNIQIIKKIIKKSHGIFLVTGPTGSGKTTTLYSCLSQINSPDKNILTIEDPIEYEIGGIGQMQVNPVIDFTFASGLRSILRQDPDVIMVGEIRDLDTVTIAIQASLTGHLVFSTLHTNDAPGAITRLLDMGVEPFLISSSLLAVMAQRLLRVLCHECKEPATLSRAELRELGLNETELIGKKVFTANAKGCQHCQFTGYRGRTGIHEMLWIDDAVRNLIMQRANSKDIRLNARDLKSLRFDGAQKILAGITSLDEVLRVTQEDVVDEAIEP
ncbi:type II secretion system ATPase GspE [bacterium]|nr:type II secretion system ATPase GspE [bacterium]